MVLAPTLWTQATHCSDAQRLSHDKCVALLAVSYVTQLPRGSTKILLGTLTKSSVAGTILPERVALLGIRPFMVDRPSTWGGIEPFVAFARSVSRDERETSGIEISSRR